jgi:hypothetical protein
MVYRVNKKEKKRGEKAWSNFVYELSRVGVFLVLLLCLLWLL